MGSRRSPQIQIAERIAAIVVAMWLCVHIGCRRQEEDRSGPPRVMAPADAGMVAVALASDGSPQSITDGAAVAIDPLGADATALGSSIEVRLVRQLQGMNGTVRRFKLLLVLSGLDKGMLVVPIHGEGFGQDGESTLDEVPAGTLIAVTPRTPPTTWEDDSERIDVPVPVRASLLYRIGFHLPGGNDDVAVIHNGDELQVFYYWQDEGNQATAWELQASVRLAPGARLEPR
jgi:hypothetical protein